MSERGHPGPTAQGSLIDQVAAAVGGTLAAAGRGSTLLWAATPTALLDLRTGGGPDAHRPGRPIRTLLSGFSRTRGSSLTLVGKVLFAHEGANPAGTLQPVIEALGRRASQRPAPIAARPRLGRLVAGLRAARRAEAAVAVALGAEAPSALQRALHAAVRADARAVAALDHVRPAVVVLASQHSTSSRAIIAAARERSIPTAYLPHAPVADTYQYRDLPTDFAGLRGVREVDFYRSLGVEREMAVIGNPQAHIQVPDRLDPDKPVIFAPRPIPVEQVRAQVADITAAAPAVVVSPHPRMLAQSRYADLWPSHWTLHDGRTIDLLRDGYPCVIQISSGVAWEAMAHGVPVIELSSPAAGPPLYPLIREPYASVCTTGDDLRAAVDAARRRAVDPDARARLMAWAAEWCARTGDDAVDAAVAWIERCASAKGAPGPLLDHWTLPGSAA